MRRLGGHGVAIAYPTIVEPQFKAVSNAMFALAQILPTFRNVRTVPANNKRGRACADLQIPIPVQPDLPVSFNIAPSQNVLAIRFNPETRERTLDQLRWGLIPIGQKTKRLLTGPSMPELRASI